MELPLEERLIVAIDLDPREFGGKHGVMNEVVSFMERIRGAGVIVKFNSLLRAYGDSAIDIAHENGFKVFADLKLVDIPNTLELDGAYLHESKPEMVTVMCSAGIKAMHTLQAELPDTEVLGVTVLTSLEDDDCRIIYGGTVDECVPMHAKMAHNAGLSGIICSGKDLVVLKKESFSENFSFNTPAIRPIWYLSDGDDQSRIMTPNKAIRAGADRIVVGRPIMNASNPMDAVMRTLDEIADAIVKDDI